MAYKDGETFTTYCDKPYTGTTYRMFFENGDFKDYTDYELMRAWWYKHRQDVTHVEVLWHKGVTKGF